jgi:hypothetical protein
MPFVRASITLRLSNVPPSVIGTQQSGWYPALPATPRDVLPLCQEQEVNREAFEVVRRKAQALRARLFSLRRVPTQQSVWHPILFRLASHLVSKISKHCL